MIIILIYFPENDCIDNHFQLYSFQFSCKLIFTKILRKIDRGVLNVRHIGYIGLDIQFARLWQTDLDRGLVFINMYDLPQVELSGFTGLIITNYVDEQFMVKHKALFEDYLEKGGVIFSFAEMDESYLPNAPIWQRSPIAIKDRIIKIADPTYPLFEGISEHDLNYRDGVKGFFTRGYFKELPKGAEVIVEDNQGAPIMYVDRTSTNGVIINGAGTDLYQMYRIEETSAYRLTDQILAIIRMEAAHV